VLEAAGLADLRGGSLRGWGTIDADVRNAGPLTVASGDTLTVHGALTQTGPAQVQNLGRLVLAGGGSAAGSVRIDGTLTVLPGTTFTITGTLANFAGTTLTGGGYWVGGTLRFRGADIATNAADIVLGGPAARILDEAGRDGLAHLAANAAAGNFTVQGGAAFATAGGFANAGVLTVGIGGTFAATGAFANARTVSVFAGGTFATQGGFTNAGDVNIGVAATFAAGGPYTQTGGRTILYGGVLEALGLVDLRGGSLSGSGTIDADVRNAGTLTVASGDTLAVHGALTQTGPAQVQVGGTLELAGGSAGGAVRNDGTLTVAPGTLFTVAGRYTQGGTLAVPAAATFVLTGLFDNFSGGQLTGGTYVIGGAFRFRGADVDYTQTADGTLTFRLRDAASGDDSDQLVVNGLATLGGTLGVTRDSGQEFRPRPGDQFQVLLFARGQGAFAHFADDTGYGGGFSFLYAYDDGGFLPPGLTLVAD
jgi:hypothetical protein